MALRSPTAADGRLREYLTTGDIGRLLDVAPRTATKLIDLGRLPAHRLPGSSERRVLRSDFAAFARDNGYAEALARLAAGRVWRVLLLTPDERLCGRLALLLPSAAYTLDCAQTPFAAGLLAQRQPYDAAVLDQCLGRPEADSVAAELARLPAWRGRPVLTLLLEDAPPAPKGSPSLRHPLHPDQVAAELERLLDPH